MRKIVTATALALALTAAACASDGSGSGAGGYGGSQVASGASQTASSTESGGRYGYGSGSGSGGNGGGDGGAVAASVVAADFAFTPSNVQVKTGATIQVKNSTPQTPHTFTVTGEDIDVSLDPQSTTKVKIDLPPGTYGYVCRYHEGSGMTGTLTVR